MIYTGLCICMFSKLNTNNVLRFNKTYTFTDLVEGMLSWRETSCILWDMMFSWTLLFCDAVQSGRTAPAFHKIFAFIRAPDEGSKLVCNGASVPD
jgi:hypothetical protein